MLPSDKTVPGIKPESENSKLVRTSKRCIEQCHTGGLSSKMPFNVRLLISKPSVPIEPSGTIPKSSVEQGKGTLANSGLTPFLASVILELYSTLVKIAIFSAMVPWHALSSHLAKSTISGHAQYTTVTCHRN